MVLWIRCQFIGEVTSDTVPVATLEQSFLYLFDDVGNIAKATKSEDLIDIRAVLTGFEGILASGAIGSSRRGRGGGI
jgi:hypothetical protein